MSDDDGDSGEDEKKQGENENSGRNGDPRIESGKLDDFLRLLANQRCRHVLYFLQEENDEAVGFETIIDYVCDHAPAIEDREQAAVDLHHRTLPMLADARLLEYDTRSKTVRYRAERVPERLLDTFAELETT